MTYTNSLKCNGLSYAFGVVSKGQKLQGLYLCVHSEKVRRCEIDKAIMIATTKKTDLLNALLLWCRGFECTPCTPNY